MRGMGCEMREGGYVMRSLRRAVLAGAAMCLMLVGPGGVRWAGADGKLPPPDPAALAKARQIAVAFAGQPDLDLRFQEAQKVWGLTRYLFGGANDLVEVGEDGRVYLYCGHTDLPKVGPALALADGEHIAREFLKQHGLPVRPDMKLDYAALYPPGGHPWARFRWQAYSGDVLLPSSYEVEVSAAGVVTGFLMFDAKLKIGLVPKITSQEVREMAPHLKEVTFKVATVADPKLCVSVRPDGTQRLVWSVEITGVKSRHGIIPIAGAAIDAMTGETIAVGYTND